ncbi:multidrug efflux RND transporter permease subunit [Campylobacter sp. MIT 99-7217]|uniref:efflux RND transporter permease subunit n=1 Tax=Campylobacter sp. MIT 99-7217 TaxID=535091 RepID=UPI00115AAD2D|nr:multidrug efflux RND transporter permease subunit [Campylobacter sp. MIT 99-7217]TQR33843.1 multidrug efflux RND transporter permease subunit [Campylobacter sp. MIT 99-7217]
MFSKFFIERPVFASVVAIIISLAGIIALKSLPVEQYPSLTPPTVSVSATYTGADAETIAQTVATPIEDAINGVEDMIYIDTTSSAGSMRMTVYFDIGTDPDQATINVNNRISAATAKLPEDVKRLGVTVRKASSTILAAITLNSDGSMDSTEIYNYIVLNILDDLKRVPGVGDATAIGNKNYSMRIWTDPNLLNKFNVTASEVISAISEQNTQYATGKIGEEPVAQKSPYVYSITMKGRLNTIEEFENIILRANSDGSFLRIKDVAKVEIGSQQYVSQGRLNGNDAVPIMINLQSGANAIEVAGLVKAKMEELSKNFPAGLEYNIPYDTTEFVVASIEEVIKTFVEAFVLVIIVMYFFLKNFRSTIIPMIAIPVSLLGTFAGLYVLGFSVNLLTLFALILAIGIVVDDAIIVVENIDRIIHEDKNISVKDAAIISMGEITSPVISIVLVLCAVFIPVSFMGGFTGQIQKQFALTLAISVAISGFVALSLTPSLCALFLKRNMGKPFKIVEKFNDFFDWSTKVFTSIVAFVLQRPIRFVLVFVGMLGLTGYLYLIVPKALVPSEDQGTVIAITNLPAASALHRTVGYIDELSKDFNQDPLVKYSMSMIGFDLFTSSLKENAGVSFVSMKDWGDRNMTAQALALQYNIKNAANTDGQTFFVNPPPIQGLSLTGGFDMYVQNRSGKTYAQIQEDVNALLVAARNRPDLANVRTTLDTSFPQFKLEINRDKLKAYGLNMQDIFTTIASTIGTYYVNDFTMFGKSFQVNVRSLGDFRNTQEALKNIFVRSSNGTMVPLDAVLTLTRSTGADDVKRFNLFPAALVQGDPAPGFTSGQAIQAISDVVAETLGDDYTIAWSGSAYQEVSSSSAGQTSMILGLVFVFLILAAQYERWLMPLAVVTAVPFAVFGSLLFVYLRNFINPSVSNDIYFQTGLLLLIGLSAKNAILIVEFAMEEHLQRGKSIFQASIEAAKLRFRPICMTSLAFCLGILPLVIATGAGSASRHSLGTGLIGGMIAASTLALIFVPLFFYLLESFNEWLDRKRGVKGVKNA